MLELKNVEKEYQLGKVVVPVLRNINFKIKKGEFVSIMGPSGSGKTTMLNLIGFLDRPTRGKVYIEGKDTSLLNDNQLAKIRNRKIGFIFQMYNIIARLTALENVMMPMMYAGVPASERKKRAEQLLEQVGLGDRKNHHPTELSGGERQRVSIARALANNPQILVADEPTGNLDSKSGKMIMEILKELNKKGQTIILVTHNPELSKYAQREVKMIDGEIIEKGGRGG